MSETEKKSDTNKSLDHDADKSCQAQHQEVSGFQSKKMESNVPTTSTSTNENDDGQMPNLSSSKLTEENDKDDHPPTHSKEDTVTASDEAASNSNSITATNSSQERQQKDGDKQEDLVTEPVNQKSEEHIESGESKDDATRVDEECKPATLSTLTEVTQLHAEENGVTKAQVVGENEDDTSGDNTDSKASCPTADDSAAP